MALRRAYPVIPVSELFDIARSRSLHSFPSGFLVHGEIDDRSAHGPRALLRRVARGDVTSEAKLHPLFSPTFYLSSNPDLATAGVSAWIHYQVFGRLEERAPHALVDPAYLAAGLGVSPPTAFDSYLADPTTWTVDPSPYVDCVRFMLFGPWTAGMNPLVEIVDRYLRSTWVHERLMLVDTASDSAARARLAGVGFLLSRNSGRNRFAQIVTWKRMDAPLPEDPGAYTVVPGFFLGRDGAEWYGDASESASPDATVLRLPTETIGISTGEAVKSDTLTFLTGAMGRERLVELVTTSLDGSVIAPWSRAQEISLRQLRRDLGRARLRVLEHGKQAHVTARTLGLSTAGATTTAAPTWRFDSTVAASSIAVVIPAASRIRANADPRIRKLLTDGAGLCLVDAAGLNSWLPQLQGRAIVVVDDSLSADVAEFVGADAIRLLPITEGARP
jgi:hypothetical protein